MMFYEGTKDNFDTDLNTLKSYCRYILLLKDHFDHSLLSFFKAAAQKTNIYM